MASNLARVRRELALHRRVIVRDRSQAVIDGVCVLCKVVQGVLASVCGGLCLAALETHKFRSVAHMCVQRAHQLRQDALGLFTSLVAVVCEHCMPILQHRAHRTVGLFNRRENFLRPLLKFRLRFLSRAGVPQAFSLTCRATALRCFVCERFAATGCGTPCARGVG